MEIIGLSLAREMLRLKFGSLPIYKIPSNISQEVMKSQSLVRLLTLLLLEQCLVLVIIIRNFGMLKLESHSEREIFPEI